MTEPTRDALQAETLAELATEEANARRLAAAPVYDDEDWARIAERYAHAAACVRRVPELEAEVERLRQIGKELADECSELHAKRADELAEVERLRAKAAIVDAMEKRHINVRYLGADKDGELETPWRVEGVSFNGFAHGPTIAAAYAAATREGT